MKLLLFSDLHLDTAFNWAGSRAGQARRRGIREVLRRICALAADSGVDALCCGGDLFEHDRLSPDTGEFLRDCFASLHPLPVLLAPGNHDWYGGASPYHLTEWSPNVTVFASASLSPVALAEGFTVWGGAHLAPAGTGNFLERFAVDRAGVNVALFHGSERGGLAWQGSDKFPHAPFDADEVPRCGLAHAFVGHYHKPQEAPFHTYPGNPDPLAFGEEGSRGPVLASFDGDGSVCREWFDVSASSMTDVEVDVNGATHSGQVRAALEAALAPLKGMVRATLRGELGPEVPVVPSDLETVAPWLDALVVRADKVAPAYEIDRIAEEQTARGQFVRDVSRAAALDPDERRRVLLTGLRAFDGSADLWVE